MMERCSLVIVDASPIEDVEEPVSLDDLKDQIRVTNEAEDFYCESILIPAARAYCEKIQNSALVRQHWALTLDAFPAGRVIEIPLQPLVSVATVTYVDEDGATQTLSASKYTTDTASFRGRLELKATETWPATEDTINAVRVYFVAGYDPNRIPMNVKQAILLLAAHWFESREAAGNVSDEIAFAVTSLLNLDRAIPI